MRPYWLALAFVLCPTLLLAQDWQEVKSYEGNIKWKFPVEPTYGAQFVETEAAGTLTMHLFLAEVDNGNTVYITSYNDYPMDHVEQLGAEEIIRRCKEGNLETLGGEAIDEKEVMLSGYPGIQFRCKGKSGEGNVTAAWRIQVVENRLYQQALLVSEGDVPDDKLKTYFDSLELIRKPTEDTEE